MTIWICRLLPWVVFVPSLLLVSSIGPGWSFALGIANGGVASACGAVAGSLRRRRA